MDILISNSEVSDANYFKSLLATNSYKADITINGKACQEALYKIKYDVLILDLDTRDHTGLEVLRYAKCTRPGLRVVLTVKNDKRLVDIGISTNQLLKIGIKDVLVKPYNDDHVVKTIQGVGSLESWKFQEIKAGKKNVEVPYDSYDSEFTKVKINEFSSHNVNIFDFYIRLSENKYVKIMHKGDYFDSERWLFYKDIKKVEYIYFKNTDRAIYVNFLNTYLNKMLIDPEVDSSKKVSTVKNVSEMYVEEVYLTGLRPELVAEGKKVCENISRLVTKDRGLTKILKNFQEQNPSDYHHLFLVSLFSTLICKNLDWTSPKTEETIAFAALFHDIGKLKLPEEFKTLKVEEMNDEQLVKYQQHPLFAIQLLEKNDLITEQVKQIIYQHHELANGLGFPNNLTLTRIYPLAKVVSLANYFTNTLMEKQITPLEGLRQFIPDRYQTVCYDPVMIKALVATFKN